MFHVFFGLYGRQGSEKGTERYVHRAGLQTWAGELLGTYFSVPFSPAATAGFTLSLEALKAVGGVSELLEFYAEAVHEREIEAAHFAVVFAGVEVVQRAAGF